jgi:murein L,D-transpeptidase YcbB/YkuD
MEPHKVLDGIAAASEPDAFLRRFHPQHPQFERLRQLYLALKAGTYQPDPSPAVAEPEPEPPAKGKKRNKTAQAKKPTPPPPITAERVLANMEQWRWMPDDLGAFHAWVNIPEFTLRVVRNGTSIHTERVIVGTQTNQTPIFSREMQTVVFQPGWGVPQGIKVKELLPGLLAGDDPIARRGLVVRHRGREVDAHSIDWRTVDIRRVSIVQPPGPRNALGMVKFLFPNKHDVYMHDTPSKSLFNADVRAFSFGCVRVRNPMRFAEIVFGETGGWSASRVGGLARGKPENEVSVPGRLDVHLTYFTVTVDDQGKAHSFRDLYGHEPRIRAGLEGRIEKIVAQRHLDLGQLRNDLISRARLGRADRRLAAADDREPAPRQRVRPGQRQRVVATSASRRSSSGGGFASIFGGF